MKKLGALFIMLCLVVLGYALAPSVQDVVVYNLEEVHFQRLQRSLAVTYGFILSDIDKTLTQSNHELAPEMIQWIGDFLIRGGLFGVATGRSAESPVNLLGEIVEPGIETYFLIPIRKYLENQGELKAIRHLLIFPENGTYGYYYESDGVTQSPIPIDSFIGYSKNDYQNQWQPLAQNIAENLKQSLPNKSWKKRIILRGHSLAIRILDLSDVEIQELRNVIQKISQSLKMPVELKISGRNMNVNIARVDKKNVVTYLEQYLQSAVLTIGDKGSLGGNDESMLRREGGFSVDQIDSEDPFQVSLPLALNTMNLQYVQNYRYTMWLFQQLNIDFLDLDQLLLFFEDLSYQTPFDIHRAA